ncbi:MAG: DNA polymerase III subunit beta [Pseudomonadota bacterium]
MDFRIRKAEFLRGLRLAQGIADRKSTMPILANVLLRAETSGKLILAATDLNVSLSAELGAKVDLEGSLTVNAKHTHDIVASLPGEELRCRITDSTWVEIKAAKVEYKLVGMLDREFPKIPDHREATFSEIEPAVLKEMIDKTVFSISNDETRFHLAGVLFEHNGSVAQMVSTDGHRLSLVRRPLAAVPLGTGVIIPRKGVLEIRRLLDAATAPTQIAVTTANVFVKSGDVVVAIKLIDSQFPPYEQVIPAASETSTLVDRLTFMESLKRSRVVSSGTRGVRFYFDQGLLCLTAQNPELGEAKEEIEINYTGSPLSIGFNPEYLLDLLAQMSTNQIKLELSRELDPLVIRQVNDDSYVGVVMPMRL